MLLLDKVIKPWKESAALNDHINLYGFWNETTFLTKSGDLGMVLHVQGVDYESLDSGEQEYAVKRLEAALKAFGPGFHVYQYLFKSNRPDIPFASYDNPVVEAAIDQRRRFFASKRDSLYQIEIFYVVLLEGARSKQGVGTALRRLFSDPAGAIGELKAQFTNNSMKTLLRVQIEGDLARLDQRVQAFTRQLADFVQISVLDQPGQFTFLRRLLNYEAWRIAGKPQTTALEAIREGAERNGFAVEGFAPTSRAAAQLRDAGISAETLQGFLARGGQDQFRGDPSSRHLYMVDESSLASTRQMQAFMEKIGPQDRVLLIGDTRQHQSVDAGKPFEQMQQAGMQTSQLDQIMRQKDPELLRAVEHLSKNETAIGLTLLQQQGRVTEIPDNAQRIGAMAKDYVAKPENTLVISPDNASRQEINNAIRTELQASGVVSKENHSMKVLTPRSDMTSVDRSWAARYQPDDVLHYTRGSKEHGIEKGSYATVVSANHKENQITVQKEDGQQATYDPKRLRGIAAYREIDREFAQGDRIQFTANNRELAVSNRDMGTIVRIDANQISVKMDGAKERTVSFDAAQMRHFDNGYAVTSHSSQGLTADRVLVNMDTKVHPELINTRFAYVSVSRASEDVRIYTNDVAVLSERLSTDVTKTSAVDLQKAQVEPAHNQLYQTKEPPMPNSREHSQEELRRQIIAETITRVPEGFNTAAEIEHRHNAPIQAALPKEASEYEWKRETGEVQSYQHTHAGNWLHIDPQGQFYDRQAQPITRETALEQTGQPPAHAMGENTPLLSRNGSNDNDQGISL